MTVDIFHIADLEGTEACAARLASELRGDEILLLQGPLGAGKTTFVRALVLALGGNPELVSSPTYALVHHYQARFPVIHVDAYRLKRGESFADLGCDEMTGIVCIEWPDRLQGTDALEAWTISIQPNRESGRTILINRPGSIGSDERPVS